MPTLPPAANAKTPRSLEPTTADAAADFLTALTSAVDVAAPGFGSIFGALIGQVIPGLHRQRVTEYLTRLAARLRILEHGLSSLEEVVRAVSATQLGLIQDGAMYASRATTSERIDAIVALVAGGITGDQERAAADRRVLRTLGDLDEVELETLRSLAAWCGAGRRQTPMSDERLVTLLMGDREDPAGWGAHQLALARLESLRLVQNGPGGKAADGYPTTAGELVLLRAGLHPAPQHLFMLSDVDPPPGVERQPMSAGWLKLQGRRD